MPWHPDVTFLSSQRMQQLFQGLLGGKFGLQGGGRCEVDIKILESNFKRLDILLYTLQKFVPPGLLLLQILGISLKCQIRQKMFMPLYCMCEVFR